MIDLFTANMTVEEQIEDLRTGLKESYIKSGAITKRTKIKLFYGDMKDVGNNILIITNPPSAKLFESPEDQRVMQILNEFNLNNFFLTYYYLLPDKKINRQEIKEFGYWIRKITDILDPKLIVCIGEESQFCFFKQKKVIRDFHGKLIGDYNSIPIYATYPIPYYVKRSEFEDTTYKDFIKNQDWGMIKKKYEEVINVKSS